MIQNEVFILNLNKLICYFVYSRIRISKMNKKIF